MSDLATADTERAPAGVNYDSHDVNDVLHALASMRVAVATLNEKLPRGMRWRSYWDKESHVGSVRDAWTVALAVGHMFVAHVAPIHGRWGVYVSYHPASNVYAETFEEAVALARKAAFGDGKTPGPWSWYLSHPDGGVP